MGRAEEMEKSTVAKAIYSASQQRNNQDLAGKIIVDNDIFWALLLKLRQCDLEEVLLSKALPPWSDSPEDFSVWFRAHYRALGPRLGFKTQNQFARELRLSQSDVSRLLAGDRAFNLGAVRKKRVIEKVANMSSLARPASGAEGEAKA